MRKTLSIVLGLIMIVSLFSFGTSAAEGEAIKDAAGFAAMKEDGRSITGVQIQLIQDAELQYGIEHGYYEEE